MDRPLHEIIRDMRMAVTALASTLEEMERYAERNESMTLADLAKTLKSFDINP